jgi:predicted ester cyclase
MPATGKRFTITGITIFRIADGKIKDMWFNFDSLGMMQQLGIIPKLGQGVEPSH